MLSFTTHVHSLPILTFFFFIRPTPLSTLFPYTTLFRSGTAYTFTVTYADNVGINTSLIDGNDLIVTSPNGFSQLVRSEEHTSEVQSPCNLVCRLLLEKKNHIIMHQLGQLEA